MKEVLSFTHPEPYCTIIHKITVLSADIHNTIYYTPYKNLLDYRSSIDRYMFSVREAFYGDLGL